MEQRENDDVVAVALFKRMLCEPETFDRHAKTRLRKAVVGVMREHSDNAATVLALFRDVVARFLGEDRLVQAAAATSLPPNQLVAPRRYRPLYLMAWLRYHSAADVLRLTFNLGDSLFSRQNAPITRRFMDIHCAVWHKRFGHELWPLRPGSLFRLIGVRKLLSVGAALEPTASPDWDALPNELLCAVVARVYPTRALIEVSHTCRRMRDACFTDYVLRQRLQLPNGYGKTVHELRVLYYTV